ncbi:hypothetical protein M2451_000912 [Dysgonomonas sp. PFB1-18]|nr:hypothetical protein [Dysgonomonas sp. PF1-14]MDH6338102.1 hypothetical protein [Dysgonomonas sp. PF1-16]MDH6379599.1 hypothetical protein [Dysgonomonas sp. PFB1-18]MDH6396929.1 hypothetical protein [Dysgonomonas sp. PF1-23]
MQIKSHNTTFSAVGFLTENLAVNTILRKRDSNGIENKKDAYPN